MIELINIEWFGDMLKLGGLGFVLGAVLPLGARLIGGIVDSVRQVVE